MALLKAILVKLGRNSEDVYNETTRLLIKIADNILKEPTNFKIRTLQKSNTTISKKIVCISGALECLKLMGFEDNEVNFVLPPSASLIQLQLIRNEISNYRGESSKLVPHEEGNEVQAVVNNTDDADLSSSDSSSSDDEEVVNVNYAQGAIPKGWNQAPPQQDQFNTVAANKIQQTSIPNDVPRVKLPPLTYVFTNPFLREMELAFHMALSYADKDLLERAKHIIPLTQLKLAAIKRLRLLQQDVKKGNCADPNVSIQDMLILEMLSWFKNDFFTWVDSPDCENCGGKSKLSHMSSDPLLKIHTDRVEMHKCNDCQHLTPFPRYNDVNILLITRKGRCGEWANTFTLLCCAMEWSARLVIDQNDHVWTEVYSFAQKRWLHCDPCEDACDTPLIYENGWGKKLSYVIAYSNEEVQDVTWRYSSQHKALLAHRTRCTEIELVNALIKLRELRQQNFTSTRREFLTNRLLCELIELMVEKKPSENDNQGRTSGSLGWRLTRGEIQENVSANHCWRLTENESDLGDVTIRYSTALDRYEYLLNKSTWKLKFKGWHKGVFNLNDVFRKEEKDWKMAYLARKEGSATGTVIWKFAIDHPTKVINIIDIKLDHKVYENGKVTIKVYSDDVTLDFPENTTQFLTSAFLGSKSVTITAELSGGKGCVSWQHAQLFRQSLNSDEYPFCVKFTFK